MDDINVIIDEWIRIRKALGLKLKPEINYPPCECFCCKNFVEENEFFYRRNFTRDVHCISCGK